jgi:DNA-binding transcriptional LysR family regulator
MRMDERQLRILRELGERGSVTAVAQALYVTPSAVSQHLRALQRTIQVPLTERSGRRLHLTAAGHALAARAADVELALARAREAVAEFAGAPAGTVSVSAFHSAALTFFPALTRALDGRADAPQLAFADEDVARDEFAALTGSYDLVLAHRMDHAPAWPAGLVVTPLLHEPLDVALPAHHRLAGKSRLTARDLAGERWVSVHEGFPLTATLDALAGAAHEPLQIAHRINDFTVALHVVAAGRVVALAPRWTCVPPPGVVLRPITGTPARRRVDVLCRPERVTRRAVRTVVQVLRTTARHVARR